MAGVAGIKTKVREIGWKQIVRAVDKYRVDKYPVYQFGCGREFNERLDEESGVYDGGQR